MIGPFTLKLCGVTRSADAAFANHLEFDWLGVNVWAGSPRFVKPNLRAELLREIPVGKRVAVTVNPSAAEVTELLTAGFDRVQAHFDPTETLCDPGALAQVADGKLWLAPRLAEGAAFPTAWLKLTDTWVLDAHRAGSFGGTGVKADWTRAATLQKTHPQHHWLLAGGLGPETLSEAAAAGFRFLDLNSRVELAPGLKSAEKLYESVEILRKFAQI